MRENGVTPARFAISCSPICQCIASTALHGIAISSATLDHMSARNLDQKKCVSLLKHHIECHLCDAAALTLGQQSGATFLNIPLVQPCEFILAVFIPLTPPFEVVLVVQSTTNSTATRQVLTDVLPLHAILAELDDFGVFLRRPLGLFLRWRLYGMFLARRQPLRRHRRARLRWHGSHAGGYAGWHRF